jgi:hypothetical protein
MIYTFYEHIYNVCLTLYLQISKTFARSTNDRRRGAGNPLPSPVLVTDEIPKQCFDDGHCTPTIRKISGMCNLGAVINTTIRAFIFDIIIKYDILFCCINLSLWREIIKQCE